jgi:hypothetical protein
MLINEMAQDIIMYKGMASSSDMANEFRARTDGRYSVSNMASATRTNDSIIMFAPHYYGIREALSRSALYDKRYKILMNRSSCIQYIRKRYAGEPLGSYPLWTPELEFQHCRWAEAESHTNTKIGFGGKSDIGHKKKIFQSLLAIAEPDKWPVSENEKSFWQFKKQCNALYHFAYDFKNQEWMHTVSLQEIFSLAVLARRLGFMNCYRVSAEMYLIRHGVKLVPALILMIAIKILRPAKHWQQKNVPGGRIDQAIDLMVSEIHQKGFVHWKDEAGNNMRRRIRENISDGENLGWVAADDVRTILKNIESKKLIPMAKKNRYGSGKRTGNYPNVP